MIDQALRNSDVDRKINTALRETDPVLNSRIVKTAKQVIDIFNNFLENHPDILRKAMVMVHESEKAFHNSKLVTLEVKETNNILLIYCSHLPLRQ